MIFYFSATGNCLHVAKQFDDTLISIPQALKEDHLVYEAETIGFVWPIYAGDMPKIVKEFFKKATFKTDYMYAILTYGKADSDAPEFATNLLKDMGIHLNYANSVLMVDNYLPSFNMEEELAIDKKIPEQLAVIKEDIKNRKNYIKEPTQEARDFHQMAAKRFGEHPELINGYQITVTDKCTGCGICARVCPVGRFKIVDGKATREITTCEFCLACAHACPNKAITTCISDKNPDARFRNENVTLAEIIKANQQ